LKVGFVQFNPVFGRVKENLEKVESMIKSINCDLLVLPELFSTGYTFKSRQEVLRFGEIFSNSNTIEFLKRIAKERRMSIVGGFAERDGKRIYNSSVLFSKHGGHFIYRKKHLYRYENRFFDKDYEPFKIARLESGTKVGLVICFDWIYPEAIRQLALKGAQIICHSANLVMPFCQDAMITRAIENRVFIVTANRIGVEKRRGIENRFTGMSQIISPEGRILARAGEREEVTIIVNVNPKIAKNKYLNPMNDIFKQRRKDIY